MLTNNLLKVFGRWWASALLCCWNKTYLQVGWWWCILVLLKTKVFLAEVAAVKRDLKAVWNLPTACSTGRIGWEETISLEVFWQILLSETGGKLSCTVLLQFCEYSWLFPLGDLVRSTIKSMRLLISVGFATDVYLCRYIQNITSKTLLAKRKCKRQREV